MKKKIMKSPNLPLEVSPQPGWDKPDINELELHYKYANSVLAQFVSDHDHSAVLRELVQNEYDAGGSQLKVEFGTDELRISGNGKIIDSDGWKRLSVMLGTGQVGGSNQTIKQKVNGIGSKNFGLRSLFLYGDQIYIRSGGNWTVLDFSRGTLPKPIEETYSKRLPRKEFVVPYRKQKSKYLAPFDILQEKQALESFVTDLTPTVMKLAQPHTPKSLHLVEISSKRCDRSQVLKLSVRVISQHKGITAVLRKIHLTDSKPNGSRSPLATLEEIEFQRVISLPPQYRNQDIPGYYKIPGGRIRLAVSLGKNRKRIDVEQQGFYYYPLRAPSASTGNAVSINAPFQMDMDRSQITNPDTSEFNGWLIDKAVDLTIDLLVSGLWEEFGPESYLALEEQTHFETSYFSNKLVHRLKQDACWPTRSFEKGSSNRPQLASATDIVVPTHPVLDGFLSDSCYLSDTLGNNSRIQTMVRKCGAKSFGISSLIRLRCAGEDNNKLDTNLKSNEASYYYDNFPSELKDVSLQRKFAQAFDALASKLSQAHREDLKKSPTTLAADGSLQAPEKLWVVDPAIASVCPIPESERLHPMLLECKTLVKLCNKYVVKDWILKTARQVEDGTASEELRTALYNFILKSHGKLDRKTNVILRKTEVLRDHRNKWVKPIDITLRNASGASQLEAALQFPHPDYEHDKVLAEAFHFNKKKVVTGDDLVKYAGIVAAQPDLALKFEETLQRFNRSLTKQQLKRLSTVAFLRSSQGNLASPSTLYLRTPRNLACLGGDASFVTGTHTELYKRLGCMEKPKAKDILNYIEELRFNNIKPKKPEILYPALVEALNAERLRTTSYQDQPIIWDGTGYSKSIDILLSRRYRQIFLDAVPQLEVSQALGRALKALGVPSDPQPQHWQQLFVWFGQRYIRSESPLNQSERYALLEAYSRQYKMPEGVPYNIRCLLDQDGRLHSQREMLAKQYLLNDDPALAEVIRENGKSIAFANVSGPQQAKVLRFYRNIGISTLTEVREQIGCTIGTEKTPQQQYDTKSIIEKLHNRSFLSALKSLADYQLKEYSDTLKSSIQQLQAVQSIVFAQPLYITYRVGSVHVSVPTDVLLDHERFVLTEPQNLNELYELLSQAIAGLFVRIPTEQYQFANTIYRILTCASNTEMANYLKRQGVPWEPPTDVPETDATVLDEEFKNFTFDVQIDPELADVTLNVKAISDRWTVHEQMNSSFPYSSSVTSTTSNMTFSPETNGKHNNLISISSGEITLPPIASVAPRYLERLEGWVPQDSNSNGGGRKGYWTSSTIVNEEYKNKIGQRGEEIIFLQERERLKELGYPESSVVWIAKNNPLADCDILSIDENGEKLWIEVKSTTGRDGHFQWSVAEFKKAMQVRERYILWRVYEADTDHPSIKSFRDPVGMIIRHGIQLGVSSFNAEVEPL